MREEGLNLKVIYKFIWERKISFLLSAFIPSIIALIICLLSTKRYTASAVILAPEALSGIGISTPFGQIGSSSLTPGMVSSTTIISLLTSNAMANKIIKKFDLTKHYNLEKAKYPNLASKEILKARTDISHSEIEGLIYISFESRDPVLSANVVDFYVNYLDSLNINLRLTDKKPLVNVLDPAAPPVKKSFPKTKISMIVSGLFGIFLNLMFIWIKKEFS
jgi:uncharacterized protein involved in exopolysaccharide biosynthesis